MSFFDNVDINENYLLENFPQILYLLLKDNTTKKNIIWATNSYENKGYYFNDQIYPTVIGNNSLIVPRAKKTLDEKNKRSKDKAEVFTPSWMCNKQNNLIDFEWFDKQNVFNEEKGKTWIVNKEKIAFPSNKNWTDYIKEIRLEITCGEGPYIVSRYDTVTGKKIPLLNRIGVLDRKFRIINENATNKEEWIKYSVIAIKSIYGYEWQGDNIILARENVLFSYIDYYIDKFNEIPSEELIKEISKIISWNIWQMDGLKGVVPHSCKTEKIAQMNLFGEKKTDDIGCLGCLKDDIKQHNGIYAKVMDWNTNKKIKFIDIIRG